MTTVADRYTDKTLIQLESRISQMYKEAQKDLRKKLEDFTRHNKAKDAIMKKKLEAGEITQAQYQQWITGQVFVGNQWKQKIEQINNSIKDVMQNASNLINGMSMDVFAENANHTAYQLEKDLNANINFGLYDTTTVSQLVGKDPEILPRRVVDGKKLEAWETKKVSNAIAQGIIQGEGIDQIANRIARDTCIAADKSSIMYARTAMTAAQNAGRIERLHEAEEMGIRVQKRWMATLDNRTRDSHAILDGETIGVDEKFSNGLMYPGDPSTNEFAEICNCRCTMVYVYPEFKQSFERTAYYEEGDPEYDPKHRNYEIVQDMTYEQWVEYKQDQIRARYGGDQSPVHKVVDGKDITETWKRRSEQFDFEIEDVINAQGFDGKPRVVDADEFDKAVQESGFIAQRTYSAPDQETLNAYRKQLYDGKWYVDCSTGGASLGQGMYGVSNSNGNITSEMSHEMELYQDIANRKIGRSMTTKEKVNYMNEKIQNLGYDEETTKTLITIIDNQTFGIGSFEDAMQAFNSLKNGYDLIDDVKQKINMVDIYEARLRPVHRVETFTLDSSAKIVKYSDLLKEYESSASKMDIGAFAAMKGYDAYIAPAEFSKADYAIILNRTKVIFRRNE